MSAFEDLLRRSRESGIDECEIAAVRKKTTTIRITDSKIAEIKQTGEKRFGIRIIHQKKIAASQTSDEDAVTKYVMAAKGASGIPHAKTADFWRELPDKIGQTSQIDGTFDWRLDEITSTGAAGIAQEMINSAHDPRISAISGSLNIVSESFEIANSNGLSGSDKATYIAGMLNSDLAGSAASGFGHGCGRTLDGFSAKSIGQRSKEMCLESANPQSCGDKTQTVILEPYSVGEILAFVAGSNFGLRSLSEGRSCLSGQMGKTIASEGFCLTDDPHLPQGIGAKPFDDEGVSTRKNTLVDDGILQGAFSNLYDGFKEGTGSTGNASRPGVPMGRSAEPVPSSAPHNLHIRPGDMDMDEMVRGTRRGLLVGRLWYTYSLNPTSGDFACTTRTGTMIIKDGRIAGPGRPTRIIHSLPALLRGISGIGRDERNVIQWASAPSTVPALRIEGVRTEPI